MKVSKILRILSVCLLTLGVSFGAMASLPGEVAVLVGKEGKFTSFYNGKQDNEKQNTPCSIALSEYGEDVVVIKSHSYFTPTADFEGAKRKEKKDQVVYELVASGKRPGGSVCGDIAPLTSYKKSVVLTKDSFSVIQKYSCTFFERHEIVETCQLK